MGFGVVIRNVGELVTVHLWNQGVVVCNMSGLITSLRLGCFDMEYE